MATGAGVTIAMLGALTRGFRIEDLLAAALAKLLDGARVLRAGVLDVLALPVFGLVDFGLAVFGLGACTLGACALPLINHGGVAVSVVSPSIKLGSCTFCAAFLRAGCFGTAPCTRACVFITMPSFPKKAAGRTGNYGPNKAHVNSRPLHYGASEISDSNVSDLFY